ncbi:hypothetical protein [Gordonia liuliyuniae]|uniref:Uncharacterized protein n=1 Tax=Gordonia liuliyuniae TaxID=2911517 RepID=A0ABS9IN48_9ACTN|nr:hypothetical protein [Gordonia liuliyuniae]MCF8586974.1 hypothetical protein [Gordonia liuliyuniae]
MSTTNQGIRDRWIADLCMHVADRSEAGSWMVAVRHSGDAVTFGALEAAINDYRRIVGTHGMSLESALTGALLHTAPSLVDLEPAERARVVDQMIRWLGRDVAAAPAVTAAPTLRSVG